MSVNRTPGIDLEYVVVQRILDDTVPASQLMPGLLWNCKLQRTKGYTSDWPAVTKAFQTILELLIAGHGQIVKQRKFMLQFQHFLRARKVAWTYSEADDSITGLRSMQQALLEIKRNPDSRAPRGYPKLQILIDKMYVRGRSLSRSRSRSASRGRTRRRSPSPERRRSSIRRGRSSERIDRRPRRRCRSRAPSRAASPIRPPIADREVSDSEFTGDIDSLEFGLFDNSASRPISQPVPP